MTRTPRRPFSAKKEDALKPITVDKSTWMYAERKGLCVVRHLRSRSGILVQGDLFYIPWSKVRRAVSVRELPPKNKRRGK